MTRSFDAFFDQRPIKRLSKQSTSFLRHWNSKQQIYVIFYSLGFYTLSQQQFWYRLGVEQIKLHYTYACYPSEPYICNSVSMMKLWKSKLGYDITPAWIVDNQLAGILIFKNIYTKHVFEMFHVSSVSYCISMKCNEIGQLHQFYISCAQWKGTSCLCNHASDIFSRISEYDI